MKKNKQYKGDRYFFDKRVIKKGLIKYGSMFLIALPILVVLNVYALKDMSYWAATFIDVGVLLGVVLVCLIVYGKIDAIKEQKRIEREEEQKRIAKMRKKAKKQAKKGVKQQIKQIETTDVEIVTPDKED